MSQMPRKDPTLDRVHLELVEHNEQALSTIPPEVQKLNEAVARASREMRLVKHETRRVRTSRPGFQRPLLAPKK